MCFCCWVSANSCLQNGAEPRVIHDPVLDAGSDSLVAALVPKSRGGSSSDANTRGLFAKLDSWKHDAYNEYITDSECEDDRDNTLDEDRQYLCQDFYELNKTEKRRVAAIAQVRGRDTTFNVRNREQGKPLRPEILIGRYTSDGYHSTALRMKLRKHELVKPVEDDDEDDEDADDDESGSDDDAPLGRKRSAVSPLAGAAAGKKGKSARKGKASA